MYIYINCICERKLTNSVIFSTNGDVLIRQNEFTWCLLLLSGFVLLLAETVYGDTTVVGDGPRHGSHARDDARGGVIAQDVVGGFAVLSSPTQDVDFPVAN